MITKTTIIKHKSPKINNPLAIVGLPGIGNVGNLISTQMIKEFKGVKFATLYSPHFPHHVTMLKSGGIRIPSNKFYLIKGKQKRRDIIVITGDAQAATSEGQYEVNSMIVDFLAGELNCTTIYTIGGYNREGMVTESPRVFGNVNKKHMIDAFKECGVVFGETRGMIWGSAGLIIAFAKMKGIDGICLMGESNFLDFDAAAAKAVITVLNNNLKVNISTANLDTIITRTTDSIKELEKQAGVSGGISVPGAPDFGKDLKSPTYIR